MKLTQYISTFSLFLLAAALVACSPSSSGLVPPQSNSADESDEIGLDNFRHPEFNAGKNAIGVTNYRQIFETMQTVTKVAVPLETDGGGNLQAINPERRAIYSTYKENIGSYPSTNEATAFNSSQALAIANLAYEFCNVLSKDNGNNDNEERALRVNLLGDTYDRWANPSEQFASAESRRDLAVRLAKAFWGELPAGATDAQKSLRDEDIAQLMTLMESLLDGVGGADDIPDTRIGSETIFTATCTAALGNAKSVLF